MKNSNITADKFMRAISEFGMLDGVHGVVVGFSGGADSAALLQLLKPLCEEKGIYLTALHVHHGIRGDEADRDSEFCMRECERLGIELHTEYVNVPLIAEKNGKGIEETARICRYEALVKRVRSDDRLDCIATAHNADDNAETVIFNLARGCGADGLYGIPPVRYEDGIRVIRPIILCEKKEIVEYLSDIGAEFIFDSTNNDTAYRRNFIRHRILPLMRELNPSFASAVSRMNKMLRRDGSYLDGQTKTFMDSFVKDGKIPIAALCAADDSVASRTVIAMLGERTNAMPEAVHIDAVLSLAKNGRDGSFVSVCGGVFAVVDGDALAFTKDKPSAKPEFLLAVEEEICRFDAYGFAVAVIKNGASSAHLQKYNETLQNIYKLSIYTRVNFDKISGRLFVRSRRDGDSYVFGGMTRKLKKLYNDRKYSKRVRDALPIFCDEQGIVWVPGFPAADRVRSVSDGDGGLVYYSNIGDIV